jgi:hypothetical protein
MNNKFIAISLNMDSLRNAVGNRPLKHDPFYFEVLDRILAITDKYKIPITFYVIGKDLAYPEVAKKIKSLHQKGHEIANHTWSHPNNFGNLAEDKQIREIELCSEIIRKTTGSKPDGFLAPAWSTNSKVNQLLWERGFLYDSSHFPTPFILLLQVKLVLNFLTQLIKKRNIPETYSITEVVRRSDLLINFRFRLNPFICDSDGNNVEFPVPISKLGIPYWFTLEFFSKFISNHAFQSIMKKRYTYILVHPADFAHPHEITQNSEGFFHSLERSDVAKEKFLSIFEERIQSALISGFTFRTMAQIAYYLRK